MEKNASANPVAGHPVTRTRNYFIVLFVLFALLTGLSLYQEIRNIRQDRFRLAASTGRALFHTIVATRSWNASHGGVYVPVTEATQPNPYLDVPDRDIRTTGGMKLTKINPAYMTRLVSDVLNREGFVVHITNLKTLRPGNEPSDWERAALEKFAKGATMERAVIGPRGSRVFRYMEPLKAEAACLDCHGKQGYRVGDNLGGISVAFSFAPYEESSAAAVRKAVLTHIFFSGIVLAVLFFFGRRIVELVRSLQEARGEIRTLEGILPICSHCKKIRKEGADPADPSGWVPVDAYISDRSDATFTHGICPDCLRKHYGEF
jgi:two-component system NtrC family sensor kinase